MQQDRHASSKLDRAGVERDALLQFVLQAFWHQLTLPEGVHTVQEIDLHQIDGAQLVHALQTGMLDMMLYMVVQKRYRAK